MTYIFQTSKNIIEHCVVHDTGYETTIHKSSKRQALNSVLGHLLIVLQRKSVWLEAIFLCCYCYKLHTQQWCWNPGGKIHVIILRNYTITTLFYLMIKISDSIRSFFDRKSTQSSLRAILVTYERTHIGYTGTRHYKKQTLKYAL